MNDVVPRPRSHRRTPIRSMGTSGGLRMRRGEWMMVCGPARIKLLLESLRTLPSRPEEVASKALNPGASCMLATAIDSNRKYEKFRLTPIR
jgi:hypothetical protein